MKKNNDNELEENKKSIKEFFLIAIPVGAFILLAVAALIIGIAVTEKKKNNTLNAEVAGVETNKTGSDNGENKDLNDVSDNTDTSSLPTDDDEISGEENGKSANSPVNSILNTGKLSQEGSGYGLWCRNTRNDP